MCSVSLRLSVSLAQQNQLICSCLSLLRARRATTIVACRRHQSLTRTTPEPTRRAIFSQIRSSTTIVIAPHAATRSAPRDLPPTSSPVHTTISTLRAVVRLNPCTITKGGGIGF
ncbi:hypothetical protein AAZX31_03G132000 [Glycine max]|uniref:Uncharacterized protein n=2 Tax=Glycine subgen. Soja TaxID=1462606 RepID=I1JNR0_SOYBN|nr:hypothetical protein JHK85_007763 [Glycine max]KAH1070106.1 hypothetical protein GYH30_007289 [Glycine max]KRH67147.1 hypothetical protein GLYMA_03G150000v4 [Glycine max]RZC20769.1 hypothetical protein D0Y65_007217 [Glycine soja]